MSFTGVQKARLYRRLASGVKVAAATIILATGAWQFGYGGALTSPSLGALEAFLSVTFDGDRQFQVSWGPKAASHVPEQPSSQRVVDGLGAPAATAAAIALPARPARSAASPAPATSAEAPKPALAMCALGGRPDGDGRAIVSRASVAAGGGVIDGFGVRDASLFGGATEASAGTILPLLASIRSQGGLTGLKPILASARTPGGSKLPNTLSAVNEGSGAFALGVAHDALDMLQVGAGSYVDELNPWYHSLNAGMRTQIVGGMTCSDASDLEAAGSGAKGPSAQAGQMRQRFDEQNLYVSDGRSAVSDFTVNAHRPDRRVGAEVRLDRPGTVKISATVSAVLPAQQASSASTGWDVERARYGATRAVAVEIVANGKVVATRPLAADGAPRRLDFEIAVDRSSWVALRLMGGGHSNPVYVLVDNEPIRASRSSVEWSQRALLEAYDSQSARWNATDAAMAAAAFQYAYAIYDSILKESDAP